MIEGPDQQTALNILFHSFPVNMLLNKLVPKVPNNILKNPFFPASFSTVLVIPFNKILEFSRAGTIFVMSFISAYQKTRTQDSRRP